MPAQEGEPLKSSLKSRGGTEGWGAMDAGLLVKRVGQKGVEAICVC